MTSIFPKSGTTTNVSAPPESVENFRPEIQALRAVAVLMVVVYHLWPSRLPGGFVGVDVFFVISGYLITSHLWRSALAGRLSLLRFYARRVRRLAPASLLVLLFVVVATFLVVPFGRWVQFAMEISGSAFLVENWVLAANSVDYLGAEDSPSPVQHFWSLSVEEQFYLVWPIIILATVWLFARGSMRAQVQAVVGVLAIMLVGSLAYSIWITSVDPSRAFFVTPARVWQFAAGGILGIVHVAATPRADLIGSRRVGALVSWFGLATLAGAAFFLNSSSHVYPGLYALIPVVGTLMVIAGGQSGWVWGPARLFSAAPVQFMGTISYSVYLWHWPLIILLPFVTGTPLTLSAKLVILVVTIALGALSTFFVENPLRFSAALSKHHVLTASVAVAVATLLIAAPAMALTVSAGAQSALARTQAVERILGGDPCVGALSLAEPAACVPLEGRVTAAAASAAGSDVAQPFATHCIDPLGTHTGVLCHEGDSSAKRAVLVWGDSHAAAWADAFDVAGKLDGYRIIVASRHGCPAALNAPIATVFREISASEQKDCAARNRQILDLAKTDESVEMVVLSSFSTNYVYAGSMSSPDYFLGTTELVTKLAGAGLRVVTLGDVPLTGLDAAHRVDIPACLSDHADDPSSCNNPARTALATGQLQAAVRSSVEPHSVTAVDPRGAFCDAKWCYAALGGIPVFTDASHLSGTFSRTLGPWVAENVLRIAG